MFASAQCHTPQNASPNSKPRSDKAYSDFREDSSQHQTFTLHTAKGLGQHLLADARHFAGELTEPLRGAVFECFDHEELPLVRHSCDGFVDQLVDFLVVRITGDCRIRHF